MEINGVAYYDTKWIERKKKLKSQDRRGKVKSIWDEAWCQLHLINSSDSNPNATHLFPYVHK